MPRPSDVEPLPEGCIYRLDMYDDGVSLQLSEGLPVSLFVNSLRLLADAYEAADGPIGTLHED